MKKSASYLLLIIGFILILIIGINIEGNSNIPGDIKNLPSIKIKLLNGDTLNLQEYKNKIVLINFWATWCPPCREEMPYFEETYRKYKDKGFVIIALSLDANKEFVKDFVKDFGITFPVAMADNEISNAYGVSALPVSFLYNSKGELVKSKIGAYMSLEEDLKKLLRLD